MLKKIIVFSLTLLICLSAIVINPNDFKVEASGGGGSGGDNNYLLNNSYIWNRVNDFANVIYNAYNDTEIPRGRSFGSKGGNYTKNKILLYQMNNVIGLQDVHDEKIKNIPGTSRYYADIINMTDFGLTINNENYTFGNPVPKKEMFVIPVSLPPLTNNYTFTNAKIVQDDATALWPFGGLFNDYSYTITTYETLNTICPVIVGNVTYVSSGEQIPEEQNGTVFLLDDIEASQGKLDSITMAEGTILIGGGERGTIFNVNTSKANITVASINNSDGDVIKGLLENYSVVFADDVTGNLTLTYNLNTSCFNPGADFVFIDKIPDHYELVNSTGKLINRIVDGDDPNFLHYIGCVNKRLMFWWWWNFVSPLNNCKGYILYDKYDHHFMVQSGNDWDKEINWVQWIRDVLEMIYEEGIEEAIKYYIENSNPIFHRPWLPTFTFNNSVGDFLDGNYSNTTVTGYANQKLEQETGGVPAIEAYNVVGNITIDKSPDDAIAVISNRYDGMWGQTPSDSGVGGAIVLGIAKYIKDYNITPKYNLTFLFTTGEEFGFRGMHHYNDSHKNDNIKYWFIMDQLAFDQKDTTQCIYYKNKDHEEIINATKNQTQYYKRAGYDNLTIQGAGGGSEQFVVSGRENCDTFCFVKDDARIWDRWHRTGANYTEGDCLDHTDQNDTYIVAEWLWNLTKYFCINTDCWYNNYSITLVDSNDADSLVDTVRFDLNVTSTLPYDLGMVNGYIGSTPAIPPPCMVNEKINFTVNRSPTTKTINVTLPAGKPPGLYVFLGELYNSTGRIDEIITPSGDNDNQTVNSGLIFLYPYGYNNVPPVITDVSASPDPVGYGFNVTFNADVTSNVSNISMVTVNISYPDDTIHSYNMSSTTGDTYEYVFNDTWQLGQYDYIIWAKDVNGNESGSSTHSFNASINATISVCTIKDSYGNNETINITDPPSDPSIIGYELLDNNKVLHIWNKYDDYYFNTSNGIQFSNHYNKYWSHNVLMLGYYNNDQWNRIYRTDEFSGFNKNIISDDMTFVNATLWKDLTYLGYDFRLAIRYNLGVDDNELVVIPYIKNIGDENISYNLGFAWEINNISVDMTPSGDYIEINGTSYYLNQEDLDETYNNMAIPCFYIREDITNDRSESLYLRWDESLDDVVTVESREGEYNAPVTLGIKIGTLSVGQEKYTSLFWHDASEAVYYFDAYSAGEAWATNPGFMTDGSTSNYASTTSNNDVELCSNNTCNGSYLGIISKVEIRAFGYYTGDQRDIILRPVFQGGDGNNHYFSPRVGSGDWSQWFDITGDNNAPGNWGWGSVKTLDCDVESGPGMWPFTLYCSKVEIRVTYTNNSDPVVSNPYPADGSIGIGIHPSLNITVYDQNGDTMNISWLSNSSGSWQVFGNHNNVTDGTYSMNMSNASVNGQWWYWRVNVSDGLNYTLSDVFSFYTGYESKIKNCGSTDFKGYLLMQVQFYNNSSWVVVDDTVNETTPRTVKWADPGGTPGQEILGLDAIFNGLVNTNNLSGYGNGTYRVYVCLRDPMGNVLNAGGGVFGSGANSLEASYEFTISFD